MCVAFIKRSEGNLVLALNRDESYERASESMQFHENKNKYSGVDLKEGGTWFSLDTKGNFSFVTNIRNKSLYRDGMKSRGEIPQLLLDKKRISFREYSPFNAIFGNLTQIKYSNSIDQNIIKTTDDVIGISNSTLPCLWPKVEKGKEFLKSLDMSESVDLLQAKIFELMQDDSAYDFFVKGTGFTEEEEKILTPIFIKTPEYGTVSTTILIIQNNTVTILEENYVNKTTFKHAFII